MMPGIGSYDGRKLSNKSSEVPPACHSAGWRVAASSRPLWRERIIVSAGLLFSFSLFLYWLWLPFNSERLQFLLVVPSIEDVAAKQELLDSDLGALLRRQTESRLADTFQGLPEDDRLPTWVKRIDFEQARRPESAKLFGNRHRGTLVVLISGILSLDPRSPSLGQYSFSSNDSVQQIELVPFLGKLQETSFNRVVVQIIAEPSATKGPITIANESALQNLRERIEKQLMRRDAVPMAVHVGLKHYREAIEPEASLGVDSNLNRVFASSSIALSDLLEQLAMVGARGGHWAEDESAATWLTSPNWPIEDLVVDLPEFRPAVAQSALTTATKSDGSSTLSLPIKYEPGFEQRISQASHPELLATMRMILAQWRDRSNSDTADLFSLPVPRSRFQSCPVAFHAFQDYCHKLQVIAATRSSEIDLSELRSIVRAMLQFENGGSIATNAPKWVQLALRTYTPHLKQPSKSAIVNETYRALGLLARDPNGVDAALISTLRTFLEPPASLDSFRQWIEKQPQDGTETSEIIWSRHLLKQSELSWPCLQRLLKCRLLANRLACDPITARFFAMELQSADALRLNAERIMVDRSHAQWVAQVDDAATQSLERYQLAVEKVLATREAQDAIDEIAWNLVSGPWSSKREDSSSNQMVADEQKIHAALEVAQIIADKEFHRVAELKSLVHSIRNDSVEGVGKLPFRLVASSKNASQRFSEAKVRSGELNYSGSYQEMVRSVSEISSMWRALVVVDDPAIADKMKAVTSTSLQKIESEDATAFNRIVALIEYCSQYSRLTEELAQKVLGTPVSVRKSSMLWALATTCRSDSRESVLQMLSEQGPLLEDVIELNLQRIEQAERGATDDERRALLEQESWWNAIQKEYGDSSSLSHAATVAIVVPNQIDLTADREAKFTVKLSDVRKSEDALELVASYDDVALTLSTDRGEMKSGSKLLVTVAELDNGTVQIPLRVISKVGTAVERPIVFTAHRGNDSHRAVVRIASPKYSMADMSIRAIDRGLSAEGNPSQQETVLFPNVVNPLLLQLKNRQETTVQWNVQLYVTSDLSTPIPIGTIAPEVANRWRDRLSDCTLVANSKPLVLSGGRIDTVRLTPAALPPVAQPGQSAIDFARLLIEIRDEGNKQVELKEWVPKIAQPSSYVESQVRYEDRRQAIVVRANLAKSVLAQHFAIPDAGSRVSVHLIDPETLVCFARSEVRLSNESPVAETDLTTVRSSSSQIVVAIAVDDCQASYVYLVDLNRSGECEISPDFAAIQVERPNAFQVISGDSTEVDGIVRVLMNEQVFHSDRDCILVGIDRDLDRSLEGDSTLRLDSHSERRALWGGLDEQGTMKVQTTMGAHTIRLESDHRWNQRAAMMAMLQHGRAIAYSNSAEIVFDRSSPRVNQLSIESGTPGVLGNPVVVKVTTEDGALSGTANVEAVWSVNGALEFPKDVPVLQAIARESESWIMKAPSDTLPSGKSVLLVRARDFAGNLSSVKSVVVELYTESEIKALGEKQTTFIAGQVSLGSQALPNVKVRLIRKLDAASKEANSEAAQTREAVVDPTKKAEQPAVQEVSTNPDGSFLMEGVRTGSYTLEFRGIIRGMRDTRSVDVEVTAPSVPPKINLRWDKRP